jgi:AP-1 complex subunit beta-1
MTHSSDFDDAPSADGQPSGLAATEILAKTPAAANLLAGTSSNPLDDLVSIFGGASLAPMTPATGLGFGGVSNGYGSSSLATPVTATPPSQQSGQAQDDLLGLF